MKEMNNPRRKRKTYVYTIEKEGMGAEYQRKPRLRSSGGSREGFLRRKSVQTIFHLNQINSSVITDKVSLDWYENHGVSFSEVVSFI
jgi:hypothetical protein